MSTVFSCSLPHFFQCPRRYGRFPLLGNCKMYMECRKGIAYPRKCPSGLYFNYLMDNCDSSDHVVCAHEVSFALIHNKTCTGKKMLHCLFYCLQKVEDSQLRYLLIHIYTQC